MFRENLNLKTLEGMCPVPISNLTSKWGPKIQASGDKIPPPSPLHPLNETLSVALSIDDNSMSQVRNGYVRMFINILSSLLCYI